MKIQKIKLVMSHTIHKNKIQIDQTTLLKKIKSHFYLTVLKL